MKAKSILVLTLSIIILALPIDAKPENISIPPYKVSFDMGNVGDYTININQQSDKNILGDITHTERAATIRGTSSLYANITIAEFKEPAIWNNIKESMTSLFWSASSFCVREPIIVDKTIDGRQGILFARPCSGFNIYFIFYPLLRREQVRSKVKTLI